MNVYGNKATPSERECIYLDQRPSALTRVVLVLLVLLDSSAIARTT